MLTSLPRRTFFKGVLLGGAAPLISAASSSEVQAQSVPRWAMGPEGQRKADLGDGTFLNPIVPGDHPDPTVLKDGDDYYMTFSSFLSYPGLVIWHSTDLVNWKPIAPALHYPLGEVWAVDLVKHDGRYFIYIPADPTGNGWSIFVIWADDVRGPWSAPVDLQISGSIDPGHVVGEDGRRYLFVNGIRKIRLTDDGLATDGPLEPAYSPWRYPDDWVVENYAPEGPKLLRKDGWFYLVTAVGGTAGPATGHMVIAARSRSVHGPWEHCPYNPLVRTQSVEEPWWSRGHATLIEGPGGDWWMIYHGYENGFRTLGRQTLLEPIEWTEDGWFKARGGDLSRPLTKPAGGRTGPAGAALSDDFTTDRMGVQWSLSQNGARDVERVRYENGRLALAATGASPVDSPPLTCIVGDRSYEAEVTIDLQGEAEGGLMLYYNSKAFIGMGFTPSTLKHFRFSEEQVWMRTPSKARRLRLKVSNAENIITFLLSRDGGQTWIRQEYRAEASGLNHNVFGGFLSLRIGLYSAGEGSVIFSDFAYRARGPNVAASA